MATTKQKDEEEKPVFLEEAVRPENRIEKGTGQWVKSQELLDLEEAIANGEPAPGSESKSGDEKSS